MAGRLEHSLHSLHTVECYDAVQALVNKLVADGHSLAIVQPASWDLMPQTIASMGDPCWGTPPPLSVYLDHTFCIHLGPVLTPKRTLIGKSGNCRASVVDMYLELTLINQKSPTQCFETGSRNAHSRSLGITENNACSCLVAAVGQPEFSYRALHEIRLSAVFRQRKGFLAKVN